MEAPEAPEAAEPEAPDAAEPEAPEAAEPEAPRAAEPEVPDVMAVTAAAWALLRSAIGGGRGGARARGGT